MLLIPGVSDDATVPARTADAHRTFELLHTWLGTILGETIGYALTAAFTVLVVIAMHRPSPPAGSAGSATHPPPSSPPASTIPLGLGAASITNFAGYVAWCLWLIAMAATLWRSSVIRPQTPTPSFRDVPLEKLPRNQFRERT